MPKDEAVVAEVEEIDIPEIDRSVLEQKFQRNTLGKIVFDKKVDFDKDLSRQFIEMPEFKGERPLRDTHVEFLTRHAKSGTFLVENASLIDCVCVYDGVIRRLNGHHTCWMRHFMPDSWVPKIRYLRYEVESEEDFRKLYSLIDRNAPRSTSHVAQARLYDTDQYRNISKRTIGDVRTGLAYWLWGNDQTERKRHQIDEIITLMETDHYQICHDVALFINDLSANEAFLRRAAVIAAMFATFSKAKADAAAFWTCVRTGLGYTDAGDPRKTIRDYLMRMKVAGANSFNRTNMVPAESMHRGCIYAWNAWRRKEKLHQINVPTAENRPPIR